MDYLILAYYYIGSLSHPLEEVKKHKAFLADLDATCRIYISEDGVNGQFSARKEHAELYMAWMKSNPLFAEMPFKIHEHHENVFPRKSIKYRKELVALNDHWDKSLRGEHLSPEAWKEKLDNAQEKPLLLDVRNDYEWQIGHFENSVLPECENFRDFNKYADSLKETVDPETTEVLMCCTGGIRCELYSAVLKARGFKKVFQLEGGIINYGLKVGNPHWKGKLFVFDDRLAIPISEDEAEVISHCVSCGTKSDRYINCANTNCNKLFLCCLECAHKNIGCCSDPCKVSPRLRAYQTEAPHKPFKRLHKLLAKDKVN